MLFYNSSRFRLQYGSIYLAAMDGQTYRTAIILLG